MAINSYGQFLIMQYTIDDTRQDFDEKMKTYDYKIDKLTVLIKKMTDHNRNLNQFPENMDSPNLQYPNTVVLANNYAPLLKGENPTKMVACRL